MERGKEGAECRLDESKMRLQAADERRKAAVLEVCACAAAAPLPGACAAPRARGARTGGARAQSPALSDRARGAVKAPDYLARSVAFRS